MEPVNRNQKGLDNRSEALPMTIDAQYTIGSVGHGSMVRLVKNFDNKVWFGVAIENPQATITSHGNASNFLVGSGRSQRRSL